MLAGQATNMPEPTCDQTGESIAQGEVARRDHARACGGGHQDHRLEMAGDADHANGEAAGGPGAEIGAFAVGADGAGGVGKEAEPGGRQRLKHAAAEAAAGPAFGTRAGFRSSSELFLCQKGGTCYPLARRPPLRRPAVQFFTRQGHAGRSSEYNLLKGRGPARRPTAGEALPTRHSRQRLSDRRWAMKRRTVFLGLPSGLLAVAGCSLGGNTAVQRGDAASGRAQAEREKESFKVFPIGRVQVNIGLPRDHLRRRHLLDPLTKPHDIGLWLGDNVRRQVAPSQEPLADND